MFNYWKHWMVTGAVFAAAGMGLGDERHFAYNYESGVMAPGGRDIETYSTFRFGRDQFYSALDQRLEFEVGLGGNVQTSLYLNFTQEMAGNGNPAVSPVFDGISNEWRFKLADNVADPVGIGLYAESEFKPDETELETKVILDKKEGDFLGTLNLTFEPEYHWVDNSAALNFIPSLGVGCFLSNQLLVGLEARLRNFYAGPSLQETASILSLGPNVNYSGENWWVTLAVLPQVANFLGGGLDFSNTDVDSQRWQIRLATSVHL